MFGSGEPQNSYDPKSWGFTGDTLATKAKGIRKTQSSDGVILRSDELPTQPIKQPKYNSLATFIGLAKDALTLGLTPPTDPTPEGVLKWQSQIFPKYESQTTNNTYWRRKAETQGQIIGI